MKLGNEGSLSEQLYMFHHLQQEYVYQRIKQLGLNEYQARSLSYIHANEGTMQKELAKYLGKSDATLTNILKVLEGKNYIIRKVPLNNERQKQLYLTSEGNQIALAIHDMFVELEDRLSQSISKTDKTKLQQMITQVSKALQEQED